VLLVCATFPLIWVGGLVTTTDSGMAVPDWPTTFGYSMFSYPLDRWLGGSWNVFIEHAHRLLGAVTGLLTIVLAAALWIWDRRRLLRVLAVVAVAAVSFQGVLGGMRVVLDGRWLALLHGCLGPAFFVLCVVLAACTSRWWLARQDDGRLGSRLGWGRSLRLAAITSALAYVQLVLGALVRHGSHLSESTWFQIALVFHVLGAAALAGHVALLSCYVWADGRSTPGLRGPALLMAALLLGQLALGGGAWITNYGWPAFVGQWAVAQGYVVVARGAAQTLITTGHVAVGSLIVAVAVTVVLRVGRLLPVPGADGPNPLPRQRPELVLEAAR
jgi:cytochrome c oxidase assembly protein subunit 15